MTTNFTTSPFAGDCFHYTSKERAEQAQFKFERRNPGMAARAERNAAKPENRNWFLIAIDHKGNSLGCIKEAFL